MTTDEDPLGTVRAGSAPPAPDEPPRPLVDAAAVYRRGGRRAPTRLDEALFAMRALIDAGASLDPDPPTAEGPR